jgi:Tfp pilus assembly protein FimT
LIFILLPIAVASVAISWDLRRLDKDFSHLYSLLRTARLDAFYKDTTIIVRFNGNTVTVCQSKRFKEHDNQNPHDCQGRL